MRKTVVIAEICGIVDILQMLRLGHIRVRYGKCIRYPDLGRGYFMICRCPAHKARGRLWEFVGGKEEPGGTKTRSLIRECREELAVTLSVIEYLWK